MSLFFSFAPPNRGVGVAVLLLLFLSACAPREQRYVPPYQPPQFTQSVFHPGDGARLPLKHWQAETQPPRAVIIALHGFNDYSHAFEEPAHYFAAQGIETYAYDQRGFGASPGTGLWAAEPNLTSDLRQSVAAARAKHPGVPVYVLGESMGGAVATAAMAQQPLDIDGLILVAPAVWGGDDFDLFFRVTLWLGAHTFPGWTLSGEGLDIQASDNIEMLRALGRDPLVIKRTRIDAIYGLVALMDRAYASPGALKIPTLILYGENDQVIPPEPVHDFTGQLNGNYHFIEYPEGWHLLLRDLQAEVVWKDIVGWINKNS